MDVLPSQPVQLKAKRSRKTSRIVLAALLIGVFAWIAASNSPFAQGIQEMAGWKHDQVILDKPFTVGPHTFRYYKFSLPEGSAKVAVVGQFGAEAQKDASNVDENKGDNGIAVYVLTEAEFALWQNGSATSSIIDSGIVTVGTMQADIPPGAGTYYLVFSNKSSPKTAKTVHANVGLRYKNWLRSLLRGGK